MIFKLFLLFLVNHIIFDFILQGETIIKMRFVDRVVSDKVLEKKERISITVKGNIIHSFLHLIGMIIIVTFINMKVTYNLDFYLKSVYIMITHFIIDEGKSLLFLYKSKSKNNIWVFLIDQLLHVLAISLIVLGINNFKYFYKHTLNSSDKALITVLVFLMVTIVTGIFIKIFINYLMAEKSGEEAINVMSDSNGSSGAKNGGFIIGILERLLIFISMLIDYYSIIGFILTAKSIARISKLSDPQFAEYFIIGNLLSFTSAIIGGVFIKYLLGL